MINTGYLIRKRHDLGWTQKETARRIGTAQACLSQWESGKKQPSNIPKFLEWCKALGVDPREAIKYD